MIVYPKSIATQPSGACKFSLTEQCCNLFRKDDYNKLSKCPAKKDIVCLYTAKMYSIIMLSSFTQSLAYLGDTPIVQVYPKVLITQCTLIFNVQCDCLLHN